MRKDSWWMRVLDTVLRPGFGLGLLAAQFLGDRESLFSPSWYLVGLGVVIVLAAVGLWVAASIHCFRATEAGALATTGPYAVIRHPIYASVLLLGVGIGFLFFTWLHFLVLAIFFPLWWLECKREEAEMAEEFGDAYAAYKEQTEMLIPGIL